MSPVHYQWIASDEAVRKKFEGGPLSSGYFTMCDTWWSMGEFHLPRCQTERCKFNDPLTNTNKWVTFEYGNLGKSEQQNLCRSTCKIRGIMLGKSLSYVNYHELLQMY